jgi:hypothetical protein
LARPCHLTAHARSPRKGATAGLLERHAADELMVTLSLTDDVPLRVETWARWPRGIREERRQHLEQPRKRRSDPGR